jgi:hypothetical protein
VIAMYAYNDGEADREQPAPGDGGYHAIVQLRVLRRYDKRGVGAPRFTPGGPL